MRLEQVLQGAVILEHGEPRREGIVSAFERAGYRLVPEPPPADTGGYRDAATPSLSLRFVWARRGNRPDLVKSVHVWRLDPRTMGYTVRCAPLWLLQAAGVALGILSVVVAFVGDPLHRPWIVGLMAAGAMFGLPKLWLDDMRQLLRDALDDARATDLAADVPAPLAAPQRRVAAPAQDVLRVATEAPALAAAARAARDALERREESDPQAEVEALERAARRGGRGA